MSEVTGQMPLIPLWLLCAFFALAFAGLMAMMRDEPARDQSAVGWLGVGALVLGGVCLFGGVTYNFTISCLQLGDHLQMQSYDAYPQR